MANSVELNGYTIELWSVACNNGSQTWTYRITVTGTPAHNISHWLLALCDEAIHQVISSTSPDGVASPEIGPDPSCSNSPPRSIKWNFPDNFNADNTYYSFTLDGCFQTADVQVGLKAGSEQSGGCYSSFIFGPSCLPLGPVSIGRRGFQL